MVLAVLWWLVFTLLAVWASRIVPGVDFFGPGLVLCLQEQRGETFWLAGLWLLLLEGMGTMSFGYALVWFGAIVLMFHGGRWLFETRSFLFMCLMGAVLGAAHYALSLGMLTLEDMTVPRHRLLMEGLAQALVFPMQWSLMDRWFPDRLRSDDQAF